MRLRTWNWSLGSRFGIGFYGPLLEYRVTVRMENRGLGSNLSRLALGMQCRTGVSDVQGLAAKSGVYGLKIRMKFRVQF